MLVCKVFTCRSTRVPSKVKHTVKLLTLYAHSCRYSYSCKATHLASAYQSKAVEANWYKWWEDRGYFKPDYSKQNTYTIILPPPNVTGTLHLGHALTATVQDVFVRWRRMQGQSVLWVPGTDHAGIATQVVVEKMLWKEQRKTRHDIGRDKFIEAVWQWKEEKSDVISSQLKKLGSSLDWSREVFTMDQEQSIAVTEAFVRLFNLGLIYRSNSLVNWSCCLQSAISDIEVDVKEILGPTLLTIPNYDEPVEFGVLTDFAYKLCDTEGEIVVSTTRIETMLGDVAIAVHPDDDRYKHLHGCNVWHPFRLTKIPVICDLSVDPLFGTGAVKISPAHDLTDFDIGKRHKLETISVISEGGLISSSCKAFEGLKRFDARKCLTDELSNIGLLRNRRDHQMLLPICSRSGDVVEMLLKPQWFVACGSMAKSAVLAVQSKELVLEPSSLETQWLNWLENIRDWCVSRQLWWGHRIPMYECCVEEEPSIWIAARNILEAQQLAAKQKGLSSLDISSGKLSVKQDVDVLDTWFSSALLPFSAFGWPAQTEDFQRFYPLTMMETGHDILFFWVARMVMLGKQLTGQLPFSKVLLHGIICDAHGRKMSKSLGNVISPENIITGISLEDLQSQVRKSHEQGLMSASDLEKAIASQKKLFPAGIPECGTDALRFTLCSHNLKKHFINFDVNECHTNSLFCNKIWQATNYVTRALQKAGSDNITSAISKTDTSKMDQWILSRLSFLVTNVNKSLDASDLHIATVNLKTFLYYEFCDVYIESTKNVLNSSDVQCLRTCCSVLLTCLNTSLRLLAPFMPFITETLYQTLPHTVNEQSIMLAPYPTTDLWERWRNEELEKTIENVLELITAVRRLKTAYNISKPKPSIDIVTNQTDLLMDFAEVIKMLCNCQDVNIASKSSDTFGNSPIVDTVGDNCSIHLVVNKKDFVIDRSRFLKKQEKLSKELEKLLRVSTSDGFISKASPLVQKVHSEKIQSLKSEIKKLLSLQESVKSSSQ